jgi:hypothetical protein
MGNIAMSDARDALRGKLIEFLADPKQFMTTNIVLPSMSSPRNKVEPSTPSGIFQFSFVKSDKSDNLFRIENLDNYNQDKPRFMAYYCHYSPDKMFSMTLGDEMNLMLTPAMNGCSFGVGSDTQSGARLVAHANVSRTEYSSQGIREQGATQAQQIGETIPGASIIGPADYVGENVFGTTVGVRRGGHWSFFMQRWRRPTSGEYILDRIIDIA